MKRTMVYILLVLLLTAVLAGCGRMDGKMPAPTPTPAVSASPLMPSPDLNDGIVNDEDGFITDGDTGVNDGGNGQADGHAGQNQGVRPSPSAMPSGSPSAENGRNG